MQLAHFFRTQCHFWCTYVKITLFHGDNSYTVSHEPFPFKSIIMPYKKSIKHKLNKYQLNKKPITLKGHSLLRQHTECKSNRSTAQHSICPFASSFTPI